MSLQKMHENISRLKFNKKLHFQDYNSSINPTMENAVGVAAFRFGHSQIRNSMTRSFFHLPIGRDNNTKRNYFLSVNAH